MKAILTRQGRRLRQVLVVACCLSLLFTSPTSVQAQLFRGGEFGGGKFLSGLFQAIENVAGGITKFVANVIESVVESIAAAALGVDEPKSIVCDAVQTGLEETAGTNRDNLDCTCTGNLDLLAQKADANGICTSSNMCPEDNLCGSCTLEYDAAGKVVLSDRSMTGDATLSGNCDMMGTGDLAGRTLLNYVATVDFSGGTDDDLEMTVTTCSATLSVYKGKQVNVPCECNSEACTGPLEVQYVCSDGADYNIASDGCVSIDALLNGNSIRN